MRFDMAWDLNKYHSWQWSCLFALWDLSSVLNSSFVVMVWTMTLETLFKYAFKSEATILDPNAERPPTHTLGYGVYLFMTSKWSLEALWSGQKLGFKGAWAEKGGSQGEILPPNKEEPAYWQSCPEMEGASSNCGVSGLWRKPCEQRRLQLPEAGALSEKTDSSQGLRTPPQPHGQGWIPEG